MPGNGGGWSDFSTGALSTGEGGQRPSGGSGMTAGEGGTVTPDFSKLVPDKPEEPPPRVPVLRAAKNVQKANIDRSSLYDPTQATQSLGADYLQQRNASNPQPLGSTGAGAVGYDFTPSDERLY